jgi:Zn-dependent peptidase ImmA (M78 family)
MNREVVEAAEAAQRLLEKHQYEIPIDVHQVARDLGLTVVEQDLEDQVSGVLVIKGDSGTVGVNKNHHINRQRFTIAHECGHYVLHRASARVFIDAVPVFFRDDVSTEGRSVQEIAANGFAAALLMPEQKLRELLREQPLDAFDEVALRRLANLFGVSTQALTIRMTRLGLSSLL